MTKRLVLRREVLEDLTTNELTIVGGAGATNNCPQLTIGGSCGIVCHETVGILCFR